MSINRKFAAWTFGAVGLVAAVACGSTEAQAWKHCISGTGRYYKPICSQTGGPLVPQQNCRYFPTVSNGRLTGLHKVCW
jgi:hypothetical protein